MAANVYEGMFILDSNRYGRDPEGVSGQILKIVQETGGEVLVSRLWEERRLAYPISGHRKGAYWLTYFRLPAENLSSLHRKFQLTETVLRMLVLKVNPKLVNTLVAHALAGPAALADQRRAEEARAAEAARALAADGELPIEETEEAAASE